MLCNVIRVGTLARCFANYNNHLAINQFEKPSNLIKRLFSQNNPQEVSIKCCETVQKTVLVHCSSSQNVENNDPQNNEGLQNIHDTLSKRLPNFFNAPHDFRIYHPDVIFEDNIRNVHTRGLKAYAWQIAYIKMGAHLKYGRVTLHVLKITSHPEDSTVRVRWRIITVPGNSLVFAFWNFKIWNPRESTEKYSDEWIDGFSIFHCDDNGKVYKHVADKVIPDSNLAESKNNKQGLAMKVALALGFVSSDTIGRLVDSFDFFKNMF